MAGIFTDITSVCEALKYTTQDRDQNLISISYVKKNYEPTKQNLDTLGSSFMYTQILKELLLTIDFKQSHINEFIRYCQEQFVGNNTELQNVEKLQKEYHHHGPIWWYTYNSFLYSMLNRALRPMEVDIIIKMGFFLTDRHKHITRLHAVQYDERHNSHPFIVYRGQSLS